MEVHAVDDLKLNLTGLQNIITFQFRLMHTVQLLHVACIIFTTDDPMTTFKRKHEVQIPR